MDLLLIIFVLHAIKVLMAGTFGKNEGRKVLLGKRQCRVSEGICCLEYLLCGIYSRYNQTQTGQ